MTSIFLSTFIHLEFQCHEDKALFTSSLTWNTKKKIDIKNHRIQWTTIETAIERPRYARNVRSNLINWHNDQPANLKVFIIRSMDQLSSSFDFLALSSKDCVSWRQKPQQKIYTIRILFLLSHLCGPEWFKSLV